MNRRKAIWRILLAGGAGLTAYSGYTWYDWNKKPDLGFLERKRNLIASLADTIIPATDTPGASEAGVQDFIITMIKDCTGAREQNKFIDGLQDLEKYCSSRYDKSFIECLPEQRYAVLQHFEKHATLFSGVGAKVQDRLVGRSFFTTLKEYTAQGYCSSELGATRGLAYLPIPGKYLGCIPLQPGQRSWATK